MTDKRFAERDANGNRTTRTHDTVPVKSGESVVNAPRTTERAALDNAAYGDSNQPVTIQQIIHNLLTSGRFEICSKCGGIFPANSEHFRTDNSKLRKWTQPCRACDAKLRGRRRMAEHIQFRMYRKAAKFKGKG